ncbi:glycosyl hydrolase family 65 protein [Streptomyces sp. ODS28]|uniref:glycoside hydrolase family 65 protein n=1 Tax=Streptomyces sp. ODS28 TaxID=3136688 RepID=UPI0031EE9D83
MNEWLWRYEGYEPEHERLREALCTLGNGLFATRGASPETPAGPHHYPGTYAAGCYNRLTSTIAGRQVENEDLVNLPDWLPLRFRTLRGEGPPGPWLTPDGPGLLEYRQALDLRHATLTRRLRFEDADGVRIRVDQQRLVHMERPHLALLHTTFTAEDRPVTLEIESALDGDVANTGVERYRLLEGGHLTAVRTGRDDRSEDTVWLRCRTSASRIGIALAARTRIEGAHTSGAQTPAAHDLAAHDPSPHVLDPHAPDSHEQEAHDQEAHDQEAHTPTPRTELSALRAAQRLTLPLRLGVPVTVEKTVALFTSRDRAISEPLAAALEEVREAPVHEELLRTHRTAWKHIWQHAELEVPGEAGRILRLHLFHVLQTLSPHTAGLDAGVPARGLHGEAYRGHVFWDELFVLRYLDLHFPEVSRALLEYRHRRLGRACRAAAEAGLSGAMYPWQSGSDGREETQTLHLNPRSQRWLPDSSRLQLHVGSAIAYNVWRYCRTAGDRDFLHTRGAEMLLQIARFWASCARFDPGEGRYRIRGVVGPDEYHEGYPDADRPGLDDNAYTNVTAAWVLARALELTRSLPAPRRAELLEQLSLGKPELERWTEISHRLRVPFHRGVISQFEGYGELAELDWEAYRKQYGDIRRLDRILEAEGDTVNRYQASKQADALMLGYLFTPAELAALFAQLDYPFDEDLWRRTVDYYLPRTSHGSTLSGVVHGWILARERRPEAWRYVQEALLGDVADVQGGTTEEGIHLGAMAGTLDLVQRGLSGLDTCRGTLCLDPVPLPQLSRFGFSVRFRSHWGIHVRVTAREMSVHLPATAREPLRVGCRDRYATIAPGETCRLSLGPGTGGSAQ